VRLLGERLEKVKSTLHCMISVINLGFNLSKYHGIPETNNTVPPAIRKSLQIASQLVLGERSSLAGPSVVRNQPTEPKTNDTGHELTSGRVSSWLAEVAGFPDEGNSYHSTMHSGKSLVTLSDSQRSMTKEATSDVEMFSERWSTLSETKSGASQSTTKDAQKDSKSSKATGPKQEHASSSRPIDRSSNQPGKSEQKAEQAANPLDTRTSPTMRITEVRQHSSQLALQGRQNGQPARTSASRDSTAGPSLGSDVRPRTKKEQKSKRASHHSVPSRKRRPSPSQKRPDEDEDDIIQALDRIAKGSKIKMLSRVAEVPEETDPPSRVESWLMQSEASEPPQEDASLETDAQSIFSLAANQDFDTRSIFSDSSLLDNFTPDTASVASSISRIMDSSDPRRVRILFHEGNKRLRDKRLGDKR
jgi:hypothetical protein